MIKLLAFLTGKINIDLINNKLRHILLNFTYINNHIQIIA